ncbi:Lrp/AsnC family transcriptional regulator [Nocardioides sp. Kera G14]|uniref:Lrp/AsnC family transcriptional regulator n=1 Tax=Nocardioides sp. Kera G14 TaxID=2884264 RepID=UPI001D11D591|nr:Lrp/AsnC family transcriptional regulator [Nocardioides sp. Kera G14]UDY24992.1 Lrp/AsnC family transcriptional regulator [Nocardioides sp. Kera G14]
MIRLDPLDAQILLALDDEPDAALLAVAKRLGVSRNTVHARLRRMEAEGLFLGFSQRVSLTTLGHPLIAFISLQIDQALSESAEAALVEIPEVVEIHATTGDADLLVTVAAQDADDLYRITNAIVRTPGVARSSTAVSLSQPLPRRTRSLIARLATP